MLNRLDHLAIVVPDTEEALRIWRDRFGFAVLFSEDVNGGITRLTHLDLGNTQLQLVQPLTDDHPLWEWLKQNGPGLHHFCLAVDDAAVAFEALPAGGLPAGQPTLTQGTGGRRSFFVDAAAAQGVRVEITGA
jgi:methylmalonyl-CoA/ethylmalonyl-CoA epimerase